MKRFHRKISYGKISLSRPHLLRGKLTQSIADAAECE